MIDWLNGLFVTDAIVRAIGNWLGDAFIAFCFYHVGRLRAEMKGFPSLFKRVEHECSVQLMSLFRVATADERSAMRSAVQRMAALPVSERAALVRLVDSDLRAGEVTPLGTPPLH